MSFSGYSPYCMCVSPSEGQSEADKEGQEAGGLGAGIWLKLNSLKSADQRQGQRASKGDTEMDTETAQVLDRDEGRQSLPKYRLIRRDT